jgi:hypothetical protein
MRPMSTTAGGAGEAQLHQRNEAVSASQELGTGVRRQQPMDISQRTGAVVIEIRGIHR